VDGLSFERRATCIKLCLTFMELFNESFLILDPYIDQPSYL
jgi:hypothetical protein